MSAIYLPILSVQQPLGEFFVASIPASVLLSTAYSHRLSAVLLDNGQYELKGSQRAINEPRLKSIGKYIDGTEAAFPNCLILAANYREDSGLIEDDVLLRWSIDLDEGGRTGKLCIPGNSKLAVIIDGQHRLFGFKHATKDFSNFSLLCAIYFELPKAYQAYLFATVNANQKPVDRSQTYELFGYNIDSEPADSWAPDKFGVFICRMLNTDAESPLFKRIIISAKNTIVPSRSAAAREAKWMVSTATIVDGIIGLISKEPKSDSSALLELSINSRSRSILPFLPNSDYFPLRPFFLKCNDKFIYACISNMLRAFDRIVWRNVQPGSYITKTVGIQAIFVVAKLLIRDAIKDTDISCSYFEGKISRISNIDFSDGFYQASGIGKSRIVKTMKIAIGYIKIDTLVEDNDRDVDEYRRILSFYS
jgi:DNA phosphorothioation-associated DGQHR protein 1